MGSNGGAQLKWEGQPQNPLQRRHCIGLIEQLKICRNQTQYSRTFKEDRNPTTRLHTTFTPVLNHSFCETLWGNVSTSRMWRYGNERVRIKGGGRRAGVYTHGMTQTETQITHWNQSLADKKFAWNHFNMVRISDRLDWYVETNLGVGPIVWAYSHGLRTNSSLTGETELQACHHTHARVLGMVQIHSFKPLTAITSQ